MILLTRAFEEFKVLVKLQLVVVVFVVPLEQKAQCRNLEVDSRIQSSEQTAAVLAFQLRTNNPE